MTEFVDQKTNLPFELNIRRFFYEGTVLLRSLVSL